jgi:hypothetical protein
MAEPKKRTLRDRFAGLMQAVFSAQQEGPSDTELRGKLHDALRAVEPGFLWIEEAYPDDKMVIYMVQPEEVMQTFKRTYTLSDAGELTLSDDKQEVERVTTWQPKATAAATGATLPAGTAPAPTAACGCGGQGRTAAPVPTAQEGTAMTAEQKAARAARVTALIANARTPWTDSDRAYLETLTDARLTELTLHAAANNTSTTGTGTGPAAPAPPPQPSSDQPAQGPKPGEPGTGTADPGGTGSHRQPAGDREQPDDQRNAAGRQLSEQEWLAAAPPEVRRNFERMRAAETARKATLVTELKTAQAEYTEAELQAMDVEQLERIARIARLAVPEPDFSGRGTPRAAATADDPVRNPPKAYDLALAARNPQAQAGRQVN